MNEFNSSTNNDPFKKKESIIEKLILAPILAFIISIFAVPFLVYSQFDSQIQVGLSGVLFFVWIVSVLWIILFFVRRFFVFLKSIFSPINAENDSGFIEKRKVEFFNLEGLDKALKLSAYATIAVCGVTIAIVIASVISDKYQNIFLLNNSPESAFLLINFVRSLVVILMTINQFIFIAWIYLAYRNILALRINTKFSPETVFLAYLLPLLNFVFPALILYEIDIKTRKISGDGMVFVWWLTYVGRVAVYLLPISALGIDNVFINKILTNFDLVLISAFCYLTLEITKKISSEQLSLSRLT